jgi:hypothetical protein
MIGYFREIPRRFQASFRRLHRRYRRSIGRQAPEVMRSSDECAEYNQRFRRILKNAYGAASFLLMALVITERWVACGIVVGLLALAYLLYRLLKYKVASRRLMRG